MEFSGSVDDDWKNHLAQFKNIFNEYETDYSTILANFFHLLRTASHIPTYMKLKQDFLRGSH